MMRLLFRASCGGGKKHHYYYPPGSFGMAWNHSPWEDEGVYSMVPMVVGGTEYDDEDADDAGVVDYPILRIESWDTRTL